MLKPSKQFLSQQETWLLPFAAYKALRAQTQVSLIFQSVKVHLLVASAFNVVSVCENKTQCFSFWPEQLISFAW